MKVVIPEYYSVERRITLLALGAEIVVTAAEKGVPVSGHGVAPLSAMEFLSLGHSQKKVVHILITNSLVYGVL